MTDKAERGAVRDAYDAAVRLLARRPLSEAEVRTQLEAQGVDEQQIASALERLRVHRYVDDERLARDYVVARSARLGHGPARLLGSLERRGIAADTARRAWDAAVAAGDVDCAEIVARRVRRGLGRAEGPVDRKAFARVYNGLLRAGFDRETVERVLEPHAPSDEPTER